MRQNTKLCTLCLHTVGRYGRDAFRAALLTQDKLFFYKQEVRTHKADHFVCVCGEFLDAKPMCSYVSLCVILISSIVA